MALIPDDHELVELTRAEKVLALGLTIFLLLGGLWVMHQLYRVVPAPSYDGLYQELDRVRAGFSIQEQRLFDVERAAHELEIRAGQLRLEYEFRREEYRTGLDAGKDDPGRKVAYERALVDFEQAQARASTARAVVDEERQRVEELRAQLQAEETAVWEKFRQGQRRHDLLVFLLRLAYVGPVLALTVWAWHRLRMVRSQYLLIGTSLVGFGIIQAVFLVGSYAWTIFRHMAQLAVSIGGSIITVTGMVALKRYVFNPVRLRRARLRKGLCPRCGYHVRPDQAFCADCGERLAVPCRVCQGLRPSGLPICPHCGES